MLSRVACHKTAGIVSRDSCIDFTLASLAPRTLALDSGSALVEVRGRRKLLREMPRCRPLSLFNGRLAKAGVDESGMMRRHRVECWLARDIACAVGVKKDKQQRQNLLMTAKQEWTDEALSAMAIEWRRKALAGELHARGIAYELETELRRRAGAPFTNYGTLDMRPLEMRAARSRWWRFWQAR